MILYWTLDQNTYKRYQKSDILLTLFHKTWERTTTNNNSPKKTYTYSSKEKLDSYDRKKSVASRIFWKKKMDILSLSLPLYCSPAVKARLLPAAVDSNASKSSSSTCLARIGERDNKGEMYYTFKKPQKHTPSNHLNKVRSSRSF